MHCPSGEIGRHSGLKIRRFVNSGRTGSIPVSGTKWLTMFEKVIELNRYAVGDIDKAHECAGSMKVSGTRTSADNSCFDINP